MEAKSPHKNTPSFRNLENFGWDDDFPEYEMPIKWSSNRKQEKQVPAYSIPRVSLQLGYHQNEHRGSRALSSWDTRNTATLTSGAYSEVGTRGIGGSWRLDTNSPVHWRDVLGSAATYKSRSPSRGRGGTVTRFSKRSSVSVGPRPTNRRQFQVGKYREY
ncbi:hypothetical protein ScPMuIL_001600 [Solemya velum]